MPGERTRPLPTCSSGRGTSPCGKRKSSSLDLVRALVAEEPSSSESLLRARTVAAGSTPLHAAVSRPDATSPDVVEYLLEGWPGALRIRDAHGYLLLELAVERHAPLDVLFLCLLKWPECVPPSD